MRGFALSLALLLLGACGAPLPPADAAGDSATVDTAAGADAAPDASAGDVVGLDVAPADAPREASRADTRPDAAPVTCTAPMADCDGDASNGCETDLRSGRAGAGGVLVDCGACGVRCTVGANAFATCTAMMCRQVCRAPFDDCDGDPANGCETETTANPVHCGRCNNRCVSAASLCSGGRCIVP